MLPRRLGTVLRRVDGALPQGTRRLVRKLRAGTSGGGATSLVSLLVITSDADARFIDSCLHSLRGQTYRTLDVVVATEGAGQVVRAICRRHATEDVRITCLPQVAASSDEAEDARVGRRTW